MNTTTNDTQAKLQEVVDALGDLPHQHPVTFENPEDGVYLDFDFNTAVVITMDALEPYEGMYALVAYEWAPDHGVKQEEFIGIVANARIAAETAVAFARMAERM